METKYTPEMPLQIIKLMTEGKSITQVCAALKIAKPTLSDYREKYPECGQAVELGKLLYEAHWEDIGQKGIKGILPKFNAPAWMYMMKCRVQKDWIEANSQKIEIVDNVKKMSDDELNKTLEVLLAVKKDSTTNVTNTEITIQ